MSEKTLAILKTFIQNLEESELETDFRSFDVAIELLVNGGEIVWKATNVGREMYPIRRFKTPTEDTKFSCSLVPKYTTDLSDAFKLVETKAFLMTNLSHNDNGKHWYVSLGAGKASAATPAVAICLAFLRHLEAIYKTS